MAAWTRPQRVLPRTPTLRCQYRLTDRSSCAAQLQLRHSLAAAKVGEDFRRSAIVGNCALEPGHSRAGSSVDAPRHPASAQSAGCPRESIADGSCPVDVLTERVRSPGNPCHSVVREITTGGAGA